MLWTGGKVTSNTPSAQTAVDERLLPALWALWNCRDNSVFISRNEKSWGKMSEERPVKKHMWQTQTAFTVTLIQDDFFNFFKWPATIASMFQWHVLYFSILKIQIDGWAVGGTTPWATLKHPFINLDICPLSFFLPLSPSVRWGGGNIKRRTPSCWLGATQLKWTEKQALQTEGATRAVDFEYFTNYTRCTLAGGPWGKNGGKW